MFFKSQCCVDDVLVKNWLSSFVVNVFYFDCLASGMQRTSKLKTI